MVLKLKLKPSVGSRNSAKEMRNGFELPEASSLALSTPLWWRQSNLEDSSAHGFHALCCRSSASHGSNGQPMATVHELALLAKSDGGYNPSALINDEVRETEWKEVLETASAALSALLKKPLPRIGKANDALVASAITNPR